MKKRELKQSITEMIALFNSKDPDAIMNNLHMTWSQLFSVNVNKQVLSCLFYWNIIKKRDDLLELIVDVKEDENFDYIYDKVADIWEKRARKEIDEVIKEIESIPIEDLK